MDTILGFLSEHAIAAVGGLMGGLVAVWLVAQLVVALNKVPLAYRQEVTRLVKIAVREVTEAIDSDLIQFKHEEIVSGILHKVQKQLEEKFPETSPETWAAIEQLVFDYATREVRKVQ